MSQEPNDTESDDAPTPNEQWAFIFNTLGKERLRQYLFHAAAELKQGADKRVYELQQNDGGNITVFDITDHVDELESIANEPSDAEELLSNL